MEALGGVASIIAVVDLSVKVLSLCSQYFKEVKNAKSDIEELQKVVANVQTQHEKTRTLLEGRMGFLLETSQQLIKGHHGCKRELEDLKSTLEQNVNTKNGSPRIMRKFGWRALKWPFDATTMQGTTQKLQKFQEDMTKGLIIDQTYVPTLSDIATPQLILISIADLSSVTLSTLSSSPSHQYLMRNTTTATVKSEPRIRASGYYYTRIL